MIGRSKAPARLGQFSRRAGKLWNDQSGKRPSGLINGLEAMRRDASFEGDLKAALGVLTRSEVIALDVFRKAGLPFQTGLYFQVDDGPWCPSRVRPAPGAAHEDVEPVPPEATASLTLWALGEKLHAKDSAVGFASRLLRDVEDIRLALSAAVGEQDHGAVRVMRKALSLSLAQEALRLEFEFGPDIQATRGQQDGRSQGGNIRAAILREEVDARIAAWQAEANTIWKTSPSLTNSAVAKVIERRGGGKAGTIRRTIKKLAPT